MSGDITREDFLSPAVLYYKENNVDQCWRCGNKVGKSIYIFNGRMVYLPECRVCESAMYRVYNRPCSSFKRGDKNDDIGTSD